MAEKDRRSRMAYSTVNAQPVKGGVGLGYVDAIYEAPMGVPMQTVQMAPAQMSSVVYAAPQMVPTASDFPILGATIAQPQVQWGPPGAVTAVYGGAPPPQAAAVMAAVAPREGVVFDASHPRNTFATRPAMQPVAVANAAPAIDWSSGGMPVGMQQNIIRAGGGAAHVSPIVPAQVASQIPLNVLRSQMGATQSFSRAQAPPQANNRQMRSSGVIQQPGGRRG